MMSLKGLGAAGDGAGSYYTSLARDDYYTRGGEPSGRWCGLGATVLGLTGTVAEADFKNVLHGFDPAGAALVRGAGKDHRAGWDLTFSAPKSVSVLWAMTDNAQARAEIQAAQQAAVRATLEFMEQNCAWTRRGKGGQVFERAAGATVATFEHCTSREQDPQLHTHCIVANAVRLEGGGYGTLESRYLYQWQRTLGALYRAELAAQLQARLSVQIERDGSSFALKGIPKAIQTQFSKRAEQIQDWMAEHGYRGGKAAQAATLDTRQTKADIDRPELFARWQVEGAGAGWGPEQAAAWLEGRQSVPERLRAPELDQIREGLTAQYSTFTERQAWRAMAEAMQGVGGLAEVKARMETFWGDRKIVGLKGNEFGFGRWSTRSMQQLEARTVAAALRASAQHQHGLSARQLEPHLRARQVRPETRLNDEQLRAVRYLCEQSGAVAVLEGMPGTGKSRLLDAARAAWNAAGYRVIGAALSGKAALGLQESAGIPSQTLHALAREWKQPGALDPKTVVVVDEAGMVDSRKMAEIVEAAQAAGAKLVLVGGHRQLQPIEAGGIFRAIGQRMETADLSVVQRQREAWAREAVLALAEGKADRALDAYAGRGFVHIGDTKKDTMQALVAEWFAAGARHPDQTRLILASERADVCALNGHARGQLRQAGQLGDGQKVVTANGAREFAAGDRIVFTQNSASYGVRNGQLGTVEDITGGWRGVRLRVRLDERRQPVTIPLDRYNHLDHGYALTTHKAQGVTVDRSFILAGGDMANRELGLVQLSRHSKSADIFIDRSFYQNDHPAPAESPSARRGRAAPAERDSIERPDEPALQSSAARLRQAVEQLGEQLKVSHGKDTTLDYQAGAGPAGSHGRGQGLE